jgi:hypothetical protein
MKPLFCICLVLTFFARTSLAQSINYPINSFEKTTATFSYLLWNNDQIAKNDTVHELITDLVEPMLVDSVIERKKQHHKLFPLGWFIHAFGGFNWRANSMVKQKFVGTVKHHGRSGSKEYTEYDINFDIYFNTRKYLDKVLTGYDMQRKHKKQDVRPSHRTDYNGPRFLRDTANLDKNLFRLHCELTPPEAFRPQLHYLFYATQPDGTSMKTHPNMESNHPTMGFYGVFCSDCNHNCHPELHPYEMTWWLKANEGDETDTRTWLFGLFHEGSNRMKKWSVNPMTGSIKLPFVIDLKEGAALDIFAEHLVFNKFQDKELAKLNLPENSFNPRKKEVDISFTENGVEITSAKVRFNSAMPTDGLKYWFSDVNFDKQNQVLSGYFHLATSVTDLYTTRITFNTAYEN